MKKLKIAILSKIASPTTKEELVPTLMDRGHEVTIIDLSVVPLTSFSEHPLITSLYHYDIVYYRTGLSRDGGIFLEKLLKGKNVKTVNLHYGEHPFAHDKTYQVFIAAENNLTIPITLSDCEQKYDYAVEVLGTPFVAKPSFGTQGDGVKLIKSESELFSYIENSKGTKTILQECIPHNCEYRVHTLGGKAVAMYKRVPAAGDFRSNISTGGSMHPVEDELIQTLSEVANRTAKAFKFEIIVADFMRHKENGEFYFTEINLNPGWQKTNKESTGVDMSEAVADYFESLAA